MDGLPIRTDGLYPKALSCKLRFPVQNLKLHDRVGVVYC